LAGNTNFWAVACSDGILQLYTMAGRRSQLSMVLGSPAAFMDCNQGWRLLVVTKAGSLHLWDLQESKLLLHESLSPLLSLSSSPNANSKGNGTGFNLSSHLIPPPPAPPAPLMLLTCITVKVDWVSQYREPCCS
jgi:protein HIRA/HIR1